MLLDYELTLHISYLSPHISHLISLASHLSLLTSHFWDQACTSTQVPAANAARLHGDRRADALEAPLEQLPKPPMSGHPP